MTNFISTQQTIKAVIFDCDGTLVDSEGSHFLAWRQAVQKWGGDLTSDEYLHYVGKPGPVIAQLLADKAGCDCVEELFADKKEYFWVYLNKGLPPIEGTVAFVRRLVEEKERHGLKIALASATIKPEILSNLKSLGLETAFDVVLSGHEDLTDYKDPDGVNKPKPYIYLHAAKLMGVKPSECVVIEDSNTGLLAGVNAGCITIAIPNSYTQHQDLSKATLKLETLADLTVEQFLEVANRTREKQ